MTRKRGCVHHGLSFLGDVCLHLHWLIACAGEIITLPFVNVIYMTSIIHWGFYLQKNLAFQLDTFPLSLTS